MEIFERIKKIREVLKISQTEFSEVFEVSQKTISNWETGRNEPPLEKLKKFAEIYKINIHWLITGEGEMIYVSISPSIESKDASIDGSENDLAYRIFETVYVAAKTYNKDEFFLKRLTEIQIDIIGNND